MEAMDLRRIGWIPMRRRDRCIAITFFHRVMRRGMVLRLRLRDQEMVDVVEDVDAVMGDIAERLLQKSRH